MTKVSIIIPYRNVEQYISQCLSSVLNQTLKEIEIICINDASEDASADIVQEYAQKDKRIIMLNTNKESGQSYARNIGLEIASGEYIGFVDADDWVEPDMFEKLYNRAKDEDVDITMCQAQLYDDKAQNFYNDDYFSLKSLERFGDATFNANDTKDEILNINVVLWNKIYKREFLGKIQAKLANGFIYEDVPFFFETYIKAEKINILWKSLYFYRQNRSLSTMQKTNKKVCDRVDMLGLAHNILKQAPFYVEKQDEILRWLVDDIFYRYTLIDGIYYEEYYEKMRNFFLQLNLNDEQKKFLKTSFSYDEYCYILGNDFYGFWKFLIEKYRTANERIKAVEHKCNEDITAIKEYYESELKSQRYWYELEIERHKKEIKNYEEELKPYRKIINFRKKINKMFSNKKNDEKKPVEISGEDKTNENTQPKVSVILPVYNVGKYLRQSLDSLINQTLTDIEIICVNDGSTDEGYEILEEYKEKDSRIKVIHKENKGTGAARNDGLRMATGECIGFVDPDDWVKPNMFERLYGLIKEKDLDIAMCMPDGYDEKNAVNAPFPYFVDANFENIIDNRPFNWRDLSPFSYPMCVWNKLYTKKLFDKYNIDFAEGLDFEDHKVIFGSLLTAEKIFFVREKLYVYRYNREGSVLTDNNRRLIDHIEIFDIVENLMKETDTFDALRMDFLTYKVHNILYYYSMIKDEFKSEYEKCMIKSIQKTDMTEKEKAILCDKYPELKSYI